MEKVLLVNDCRLESLVMKDILKNLGYEVSISNEYEAMSEVREFSPDILICNLIMKEIKGNLLIYKIKTMHPEVKCYLSSSCEIKLSDYKRYGVDEVIHTPISGEIMKRLLEGHPSEEGKINKMAFCPYCGGKFGTKDVRFSFCPFCGKAI